MDSCAGNVLHTLILMLLLSSFLLAINKRITWNYVYEGYKEKKINWNRYKLSNIAEVG